MRKVIKFVFVLIIIMSFNNVYASTNVLERNESNNYGINKDYEITPERLEAIKKTKYVDANEKIYDYSDILTDEEESVLYGKIQYFIEKTNMDLVILTDNIPYTYDTVNDNYAADFYDYNDFGINSEHYDGVIFFRNTYEEDHYYGIYMTGNAMRYFTNERNDMTLDNIYYDMSDGNYLEGIEKFIDEFLGYYESGIPSSMESSTIDENGKLVYVKIYKPPFVLAIVVALITAIISISVMIKKNKMVYKAMEANEYLDKESLKYNLKDSRLISTNTVRHYNPPSSSSSGGSHSFSGSSGGGHSGGGRHG